MAYTGSKSQTGEGSSLSIAGPATAAATGPVVIGEITDLPFKLPPYNMVNTTNLQSTIEEETPTIPKITNFNVMFNRVQNDAGQLAVEAAYAAKVAYNFIMSLPPNPLAGQANKGDSWAFTAYIIDYTFSSIKSTDTVKNEVQLQYTTIPVFTAGS